MIIHATCWNCGTTFDREHDGGPIYCPQCSCELEIPPAPNPPESPPGIKRQPMKAPHKFSLAIRIIGWIFTVWLGSSTLILGIGGIYELTQGTPEAGMILLSACFCLGLTGIFAWLATARSDRQSPEQ